MQSTDTRTSAGRAAARERERAAALAAVVEDLGAELSLRPLLERILERSITLLGGDAGSICLVDEAAGVYRKEADIGVACQSGRVFPLTEGVTGAVVGRRASVVFDDYAEVPGGHVPEADRASLRGVIGVPIWWRTSIIGSCVVFSRDPDRTFSAEDAHLLELFAKHAALAITYARLHEAAEANARAEAAAEERNRMAREVHDTVAKGLVSVLLHLRTAEAGLEAGHDAELAVGAERGARGGAVRPGGDAAQRARAGARRRSRAARWRRPSSGSWPGPTAPARPTCGWWWPARRARCRRRGPRALPDRPGGAHQRAAPRGRPLGARRHRLLPRRR